MSNFIRFDSGEGIPGLIDGQSVLLNIDAIEVVGWDEAQISINYSTDFYQILRGTPAAHKLFTALGVNP